jgi:hypothetical protein
MSFNTDGVEYFGVRGLSLIEPGELVTDVHGSASCSAVWRLPALQWSAFPKWGHHHPVWSSMRAFRSSMKIEGPWVFSTIEYSGPSPFSVPFVDALSEPIYETVIGLSEDPIDTHPHFVELIGGTPSSPLNGARFVDMEGKPADASRPASSNEGWVFDSFALIHNGKKNPKAKVTSYLNPTKITYRKTWASKTRPNINNAGKIGTPPGNPPPLPGSAEWMNMGITSSKNGHIYNNTEEWMASGPNGWDKDIY